MKEFLSILLIMTIILAAPSVYAQDPGSKLLRGLVNTATGLLELPITVYKMSMAEGYPTGLTYGVGKGLINGIYRTLVGIYEVVTFPIPAPADYKSILTPDTLLTAETLERSNPSMRSDFSPLRSELEKPSAEK